MGDRKLKSPQERNSAKKTSVSQELGLLFKNQRLNMSMPEEQVASYLGISKETLLAYESGTRTIPLTHIYALSNCLNIDPKAVLKLINKLR